jgi:hypothetical protein
MTTHSLDQAQAGAHAKVREYVSVAQRALNEHETEAQAFLAMVRTMEVQRMPAEGARALFATALMELAQPATDDLSHLDFEPGGVETTTSEVTKPRATPKPYMPPNTEPVFVLTRDLIDAMHEVCVAEDAVLDLAGELGDKAPMAIKHQAARIRAGRVHGCETYKQFQDAHSRRPVIARPEVVAVRPETRRWWGRKG